MEIKSLYDGEVYQQCLDKIEKITEETKPQWGSMNSAQMFAHCSEIQEATNGKKVTDTPFFLKLFLPLVKRLVVISKKPYKRGERTHPKFKQKPDKDFAVEKKRLLAALDKFHNTDKKTAEQIVHSLFGKMSLEEKGWAMYKHIDHHLTQFGA
jgi:hypothetical protein